MVENTYTFDVALADAAVELADSMADIAKLAPAERVTAILEWTTEQSELAHSKVDAHTKTLTDAKDKRDNREKNFRDLATKMFTDAWTKVPEMAKTLLTLAKDDAHGVKGLTLQVTVHTEEKNTAPDGQDAVMETTYSLGSPVVMLGTRVAPKAKAKTSGNGKGGGQPITVDGKEYPSARAASSEVLNDEAGANRDAIIKKLENAGHTVS